MRMIISLYERRSHTGSDHVLIFDWLREVLPPQALIALAAQLVMMSGCFVLSLYLTINLQAKICHFRFLLSLSLSLIQVKKQYVFMRWNSSFAKQYAIFDLSLAGHFKVKSNKSSSIGTYLVHGPAQENWMEKMSKNSASFGFRKMVLAQHFCTGQCWEW